MRICEIKDKKLIPYEEHRLKEENIEKDLEDWLESNPNCLLDDEKILIIGRQVSTNFDTRIDLLGIDQEGDVVVIELKRDITPRDTLAQALEYASFAKTLSYDDLNSIFADYKGDKTIQLLDEYKKYFQPADNEVIVFNNDQKIIIVGETISREVRQSALFLREKGIQIFCVEFKIFVLPNTSVVNEGTSGEGSSSNNTSSSGRKLIIFETVVGREPIIVKKAYSSSRTRITKEGFLGPLDQEIRDLFSSLLDFAERNDMPIYWGSAGFSIRVEIARGIYVTILEGYSEKSSYGENIIYTAFADIIKKVNDGKLVADFYRDELNKLGCFENAGNELKCSMKKLKDKMNNFLDILSKVADKIKQNGPIS